MTDKVELSKALVMDSLTRSSEQLKLLMTNLDLYLSELGKARAPVNAAEYLLSNILTDAGHLAADMKRAFSMLE